MTYTRHCPSCGREWEVPDHVIELFHRCTGEDAKTRRVIAVGLETTEERRSALWAALVAAVDDEALYRR